MNIVDRKAEVWNHDHYLLIQAIEKLQHCPQRITVASLKP
jgi:hypothetical protein